MVQQSSSVSVVAADKEKSGLVLAFIQVSSVLECPGTVGPCPLISHRLPLNRYLPWGGRQASSICTHFFDGRSNREQETKGSWTCVGTRRWSSHVEYPKVLLFHGSCTSPASLRPPPCRKSQAVAVHHQLEPISRSPKGATMRKRDPKPAGIEPVNMEKPPGRGCSSHLGREPWWPAKSVLSHTETLPSLTCTRTSDTSLQLFIHPISASNPSSLSESLSFATSSLIARQSFRTARVTLLRSIPSSVSILRRFRFLSFPRPVLRRACSVHTFCSHPQSQFTPGADSTTIHSS